MFEVLLLHDIYLIDHMKNAFLFVVMLKTINADFQNWQNYKRWLNLKKKTNIFLIFF